MTLNDLGAIGDLVGGLGVIVSLLYLATQIRQANRVSRAQTVGNIASHWSNFMLQMAGNAQLMETLMKPLGGGALNEREMVQMLFLIRGQMIGFENYFVQHQLGFMDAEGWQARRTAIAEILSSAFVITVWKERLAHTFHPDFQREVSSILAEQSASGRSPENDVEVAARAVQR